MTLFKKGGCPEKILVQEGVHAASDQQILEQDPEAAHHIPFHSVSLSSSIPFHTTAMVSAQRMQETANVEYRVEDIASDFIIELDEPPAGPDYEALVVESSKAQTHEVNHSDARGRRKRKGLSAAKLQELAEDATKPLVRRESDSDGSNPSKLLGSYHGKSSSQISLHSVLERHPRDVGAVPFGTIHASAAPALYTPKLLSADMWYRAYCPERKHHVRPRPPVSLPQAEGITIALPAICAATLPSVNNPQVMFTTLIPEARPAGSSTDFKATLNTISKRAAKRATEIACSNLDTISVKSGNTREPAKVLPDARAANVVETATICDIQSRSKQLSVSTQAEKFLRRDPNQCLVISQPIESHKATTAVNTTRSTHGSFGSLQATLDPYVTKTATKATITTVRIAEQCSQKVLDQSLNLQSRPIKSLKRKRPNELPDDEHSDLPFRTLHNLLKMIQKNVEEALFFFVKKLRPDYLRQRGWEVPEQGELTKTSWWKVLMEIQVLNQAVDFGDIDLEALYTRIAQIRHAAVHRLEVSNLRLEKQMIPDAIRFLHGLRDIPRKNKLREIQWIFTRDLNNGLDLHALQQFLGMEPESAKAQEQSNASFSRPLRVEPPRKKARFEEPAHKYAKVKKPVREYIVIEDDDRIREFVDLTQEADETVDAKEQNTDDGGDRGDEEADVDGLDGLYRGLLEKLI